jgi:ketosteroid isomerase-like protein
MAEHPHAALVRRAIEALNTQNYEILVDLMADDVVWHVIGSADPVVGKAAMASSLGGGGGGEYTITATLHDVTASDDHTIALVSAHATKGDQTLDYNTAEIFHLKDGKVTERWAFSDDTARINAFFS